MATKIYTRTGDQGQTALFGGRKVSKADARIAAYGAVDTLNAYLGWLSDLQQAEAIRPQLRPIQETLFVVGALLAADPDKADKLQLPDLQQTDIDSLERAIDRMDAEVPPLRSFILPGGHPVVSACHIARCHCREAERCCVGLQETAAPMPGLVIPYLNRLSDYLFMLARYTAHQLQVKEIPWRPKSS